MNIIKELWRGNVIPQDSDVFDKPQLKELLGYMSRHREALESTLTDEQKEVFEKYMDNRNEYDYLAQAEVFEYGFRLGAKFVLDVLKEE